MQSQSRADNFDFRHIGFLKGHSDWVTAIVTNQDQTQTADLVISASRDKSIIIWKLFENQSDDLAGEPRKALTGHSHFINDLSLSNENKFLISASWDNDLRLWDLNTGTCSKRFVGHDKEIAFHQYQSWVAAATENEIRIWQISEDKEDKKPFCVLDEIVEVPGHGKRRYGCTSLAFDATGHKLYGGFTNGRISVWEIIRRT